MPERNSRSRIRSSQSLPRLSSSGSFHGQNKETVYFVCGAKAFARKTLKSKEQFSQEGVERFVRRGPHVRPNHFELYFLEDRIRFKPLQVGLRTHSHATIPYKQIRGAFSILEKPSWLILGVFYPEKNQRKLESFYFQTTEEADRAKELLLLVKNNPDGRLQGVQAIGFVSSGSTRSLSRPTSVEYQLAEPSSRNSSIYSPRLTEYTGEAASRGEIEVQRSSYLHSQATSPIIQPIMLSESPMGEKHVTKYRPVNKEFPYTRRTASMHDSEDRIVPVSHWQARSGNSERNNSSSYMLSALASDVPGSLIFISNTPTKGVHVSDDGPVYMFCQVEP